MTNPLNMLAESLQATSRVLSAQGANEQAMLQESAVQLLGHFILEDVQVEEVLADGSGQVTRDVMARKLGDADVASMLKSVANAVWRGGDGEHLALLIRVVDADDWSGLPIQLQNYVAEEQMPCHVVLCVQQMRLEGDVQHRHFVLPVFAVLCSDGAGGLNSVFAFAQLEHRKQVQADPAGMRHAAAATLEPYLRLVAAYAVKNVEVA